MAKKKKDNKKSPKNTGWDFFRIMRRVIKKDYMKYALGGLASILSLAIFWRSKSLKGANLQYERTFKTGLLIAGVIVLVVIYGIYNVLYRDKSYPNVSVAAIQVGGKNLTEIKEALDNRVNDYETKKIDVNYKDKKWQLDPVAIQIAYDSQKTAEQVYATGREKTVWRRFKSRLAAIVRVSQVKPVYSYDSKAFNSFIDKVSSDVDVPEKDATGVIKKGNVTFVAERNGLRVEKSRLRSDILNSFNNLMSKQIKVQVKTSYPNVTLGDTESARQLVLQMLKSKLTLKWQKGSIDLDQEDFSDWIKFNSVIVEGTKDQYQLSAYVDSSEVKNYLKQISKNIEQNPKNAKLAINNGVLSVIEPSATGYVFDAEMMAGPIVGAIQNGEVKNIDLAVKEVQPDVTESNYTALGINEIIGSGATNFSGSLAARRANIANGTRIVNGTLIKPGDEFSTVKTIGNVDASTGFVIGLVIKNNKTLPEYGGGLCQVSSTLFRAALNTGLKITERKNHAYRVGYYEKDGSGKYIGPGLDSTIYGPHPDMKFVNDTGHYILVQGYIEKNKLTFDFWGTKDGRVSTVSVPTISNVIPAPPAQYVNTDTLFVGQKEQTETSHPGSLVVVNYSVVKDGKEIIKQTFTSKYKPWGAVYLVGTKPLPAPVTPSPIVPEPTPVTPDL